MATSTHSSQGPKKGRSGCITPLLSRVPNKGDTIRSGYITPSLFMCLELGKMGRPNQKWLHHPCLLCGLKLGKIAT